MKNAISTPGMARVLVAKPPALRRGSGKKNKKSSGRKNVRRRKKG